VVSGDTTSCAWTPPARCQGRPSSEEGRRGRSSIASPPRVGHEGGRVAATDVTLHLGVTATGFVLHHRCLTFVVEYLDEGAHWRGAGSSVTLS
jgi:hypothetical protein